jgi:hypothetical protein
VLDFQNESDLRQVIRSRIATELRPLVSVCVKIRAKSSERSKEWEARGCEKSKPMATGWQKRSMIAMRSQV